ncbi:3-dehydroquinate synthase [Moraxella macacae 0408225]|uniref:3-dehydroquinate synthase n=1 Tax=Moraxella macacae 0408225 TaxID=1230338 RepID=L2F953_9GAMM|nr:3-dehydroquinate synthase [Moraxella macacae]ELA09445.1 3-dehydroquinate synthase [Moraxella macacae 0408225]
MEQLLVKTRSHDYPILIGENLLANFDFSPFIKGKQILIVTNETIAPLYLQTLIDGLAKEKTTEKIIVTCILPDGEQFKNQDSINQIYDVLMQNHFNRDCTLIALGGGVIGDMVGFAAASFMRGVAFIQIPTTLLSQVDSSVGGKTGINHKLGKNMIGAFWQPKLVLVDMTTLTTLPQRELSAGLAEVIKYALIGDLTFLAWLENHMEALVALDLSLLAKAVFVACEHKANIVAEDEFESGKRALLNFGHTFGHVIETYEGYGNWLHGEAVAVGMIQAMQLSQKMGYLTPDDVWRVQVLLTRAKLPIAGPKIALDIALDLMRHDKKAKSGQIRLILLKKPGEAFITADYDAQYLCDVLS